MVARNNITTKHHAVPVTPSEFMSRRAFLVRSHERAEEGSNAATGLKAGSVTE